MRLKITIVDGGHVVQKTAVITTWEPTRCKIEEFFGRSFSKSELFLKISSAICDPDKLPTEYGIEVKLNGMTSGETQSKNPEDFERLAAWLHEHFCSLIGIRSLSARGTLVTLIEDVSMDDGKFETICGGRSRF
jgi:hypothetical protein|tara:strand:- start:2941 stop:3342 length:402 start_codon:yes stop_codon:yes gene_type:complete